MARTKTLKKALEDEFRDLMRKKETLTLEERIKLFQAGIKLHAVNLKAEESEAGSEFDKDPTDDDDEDSTTGAELDE
jgi:hypothetical protein